MNTDTRQLIDALSRRFADGLGQDDIMTLLQVGRIVEHAAGSDLIEELQPVRKLFVVVEGSVAVYLPKAWDRASAVELCTLGPGSCCGEFTLFDKGPASASVRTMNHCRIFEITHTALDALVSQDPAFGVVIYRNMLTALVRRLRASNFDFELLAAED